MSQPQDASNQDQPQPLIVYVPIPFVPPPSSQQQPWQQELFWQMNPLLGSSGQPQNRSSLPFPSAIVTVDNPPLTVASQVKERSIDLQQEEDREFERKKRDAEGNFGKIIFGISYCYVLGVLFWLVTQGQLKLPFVTTASQATVTTPITTDGENNRLATTQVGKAAIANNFGSRSNDGSSLKVVDNLSTKTIATQAVPVPPPPPIPTGVVTNNQLASGNNLSQQKPIPPSPLVKVNSGNNPQKVTQQFKPTQPPATIKTPQVVKIPTAPQIQVVPSTSNSTKPTLTNSPVPPPPPTTSTNLPNQKPTEKIAMVEPPQTLTNSSYILMGILEVGEQSGALFEIDGVVQTIKLDEVIGNSGWKLVAVTNGRIKIARNGQTRSLSVEEKL
jgi:hypothetical protein